MQFDAFPSFCAASRGFERKTRLIGLKGGECERCHEIYPPQVYDFHHTRPTEKEFPLTQNGLARKAWVKIMEEVKKVALVCSNCHRMIHAFNERRWINPEPKL